MKGLSSSSGPLGESDALSPDAASGQAMWLRSYSGPSSLILAEHLILLAHPPACPVVLYRASQRLHCRAIRQQLDSLQQTFVPLGTEHHCHGNTSPSDGQYLILFIDLPNQVQKAILRFRDGRNWLVCFMVLTIAVIKWMEYIKFNKNFIFSSIFGYLHKFLCFHAGNNRYKQMAGMMAIIAARIGWTRLAWREQSQRLDLLLRKSLELLEKFQFKFAGR